MQRVCKLALSIVAIRSTATSAESKESKATPHSNSSQSKFAFIVGHFIFPTKYSHSILQQQDELHGRAAEMCCNEFHLSVIFLFTNIPPPPPAPPPLHCMHFQHTCVATIATNPCPTPRHTTPTLDNITPHISRTVQKNGQSDGEKPSKISNRSKKGIIALVASSMGVTADSLTHRGTAGGAAVDAAGVLPPRAAAAGAGAPRSMGSVSIAETKVHHRDIQSAVLQVCPLLCLDYQCSMLASNVHV